MIRINQRGAINILLVPFILVIIVLIIAISFGGWAFSSRQDYKNNVDAKISAAVTIAKQQQSATDAAAYAQASKSPLQTYNGPEQYGSFRVSYPKTWSAYVDSNGGSGGNSSFDAYYYPQTVPSTDTTNVTYALRISVLNQDYADTMSGFTGLSAGQVSVAPYSLPKVSSVVGSEVTGQIEPTNMGTMIVLPLRTQTLEIWTEGNLFQTDFTTSILPNFTFSP